MKLSWHFQTIPSWATREFINAEYVKVMDPPEDDPFPNSKVIGRRFIGDKKEEELVRKGEAGAEEYFELVRGYCEERPWVHAWEGVNEPYVGTAEAIDNLVRFTKRWAEKMHTSKWKTVGLNLGVGWPQVSTAKEFVSCLPYLDYVGLHEYSAPKMQDGVGWYCLRYRRTYDVWEALLEVVPPLLITECGIDGGVIDGSRTGWKTFAKKRDVYWEQLLWYNEQLARDGFVRAAVVFTSGPDQTWKDFDFDQHLSRRLHNAIESSTTLEDWLGEQIQEYVIPQNPDAAFHRFGRERGWEPISGEETIEHDSTEYVVQAWYDGTLQQIVYAIKGDWANIKVFERQN